MSEPHVGTAPLSRGKKWMFAAAFMGMWGPLTVFGTHRTTLFVIYYQADVKVLSLIGIIAGLVDAINGPFIASWADAGIANRLKCFPVASWGRRTFSVRHASIYLAWQAATPCM